MRHRKSLQKFALCLTPSDYEAFRSNPATKLYQHTYDKVSGEIVIWAARPLQLAKDLEKAIDFGATSADAMLTLRG